MNVKEAISRAKVLLEDLYAEESVADVRLEEVEFDEASESWLVTLGIMRPAVRRGSSLLASEGTLKRTYKVVKIPETGDDRPSIKIREFGLNE